VQQLLDLGVRVDALYDGDPYFDIAKDSTALHVAAWKAWPKTVKLLIERGAPINAQELLSAEWIIHVAMQKWMRCCRSMRVIQPRIHANEHESEKFGN
jgi:hypothetical protein